MTDKRPIWLALGGCFAAILLAIASYVLGYHLIVSRVIVTTIAPLTLAALFGFIAFWHSILVRREMLETEDKARLSREYDREDLFGDADEALDLAADAHRNFDKWFLTIFTVITGLLLLARASFYYLGWLGEPAAAERNALSAAGLSFFMMIFCLLAGTYYNGASREAGCRFLRPVANWFLFASFIYALAFLVMLVERFEIGQWDTPLARIIVIVIAVLAIEMIFNFIIEFYRPRLAGEVERPLYESRILSVITEPGGIAKNVAHALDYQFGFKVSETWFYSFLEKAVVPFVALLLLTLYLLDCFVLIDSHQMGIRETFGSRSETALKPGLHLKLPAPMQRIMKYSVENVRHMSVGYVPFADGEQGHADPEVPEEQMDTTGGRVILWNKHHYKEETHFLVPAQRPADEEAGNESLTVPVSFLSANIYLKYKINPDQLYDYAFNYDNPDAALQQLLWREATVFMANQDFVALLSTNYQAAQADLAQAVREAVARTQPSLGIELLTIGISGVHPPVEVADAFQNVVGADIEARTRVITAQAEQQRELILAGAQATSLESAASAYAATKSSLAKSEAQRFESQLKAYEAAGPVFVMRTYMDMLEQISGTSRKFIVAAPSADHVQIFDFTERVRPDLQDIDLNAPEN